MIPITIMTHNMLQSLRIVDQSLYNIICLLVLTILFLWNRDQSATLRNLQSLKNSGNTDGEVKSKMCPAANK